MYSTELALFTRNPWVTPSRMSANMRCVLLCSSQEQRWMWVNL